MKELFRLTLLISLGWMVSRILRGMVKERINEEIKILEELKEML